MHQKSSLDSVPIQKKVGKMVGTYPTVDKAVSLLDK